MNVDYDAIEKAWFKPKKTVLNELEEWVEEKVIKSYLKGCSFEQTYITGKWNAYKKTLNKIQELKKGEHKI